MTAPTFDGTYQLLVPTDMLNVLEPTDKSEATTTFSALFTRMFPSIPPDELEMMVDGILRWRDLLLDRGIIFHGVTAIPADVEVDGEVVGPVNWHVFAGVVEVPVHDEVDAGEVTARLFGHQFTKPGTHAASFDTVMGWGAGLITEVDTLPVPVGDASTMTLPASLAVAAVLSAAHGSDRGPLVVGFAVDVEHKHELAALVGLIGGRSTIAVGDAELPAVPISASTEPVSPAP